MKRNDIYCEILVGYDVQKDKSRNLLANALKDIGLISIQKSVFWGYATLADRKAIQSKFSEFLDQAEDRAFIIPVNFRERILGGAGFGYTPENLPEYCEYGIL